MHEVRERLAAGDLDHRDPLPVAGFELRVAGDVDFLELERRLGPNLLEHAPRRVAEMAARRGVEHDARHGSYG